MWSLGPLNKSTFGVLDRAYWSLLGEGWPCKSYGRSQSLVCEDQGSVGLDIAQPVLYYIPQTIHYIHTIHYILWLHRLMVGNRVSVQAPVVGNAEKARGS